MVELFRHLLKFYCGYCGGKIFVEVVSECPVRFWIHTGEKFRVCREKIPRVSVFGGKRNHVLHTKCLTVDDGFFYEIPHLSISDIDPYQYDEVLITGRRPIKPAEVAT